MLESTLRVGCRFSPAMRYCCWGRLRASKFRWVCNLLQLGFVLIAGCAFWIRARGRFDSDFCLGLLAACRAAGDFLFLRSQEKEAKEGNPLPVSLWALLRKTQAGNLCARSQGAAAELAARLQRFAQTAAASLITKQMRPSAHLRTLSSPRLGTGRRWLGFTKAPCYGWRFFLLEFCWPLIARRRVSFLCFVKKRNQKKDDPATHVPPQRFGQPAVLDHRVLPQNSPRAECDSA